MNGNQTHNFSGDGHQLQLHVPYDQDHNISVDVNLTIMYRNIRSPSPPRPLVLYTIVVIKFISDTGGLNKTLVVFFNYSGIKLTTTIFIYTIVDWFGRLDIS